MRYLGFDCWDFRTLVLPVRHTSLSIYSTPTRPTHQIRTLTLSSQVIGFLLCLRLWLANYSAGGGRFMLTGFPNRLNFGRQKHHMIINRRYLHLVIQGNKEWQTTSIFTSDADWSTAKVQFVHSLCYINLKSHRGCVVCHIACSSKSVSRLC